MCGHLVGRRVSLQKQIPHLDLNLLLQCLHEYVKTVLLLMVLYNGSGREVRVRHCFPRDFWNKYVRDGSMRIYGY